MIVQPGAGVGELATKGMGELEVTIEIGLWNIKLGG